MSADPIIAIDAMGGDHAPMEIVAGALLAHGDRLGRMILVGDSAVLEPLVQGRIEIVHAPDAVAMDAAPTQALRSAATSSLGVAIDLVRDGKAHAVVSAGSSGAFLAIALVRLRTIAGIARPAIATVLPTLRGVAVLIDSGANVDCRPEWFVQFGIMGAAYAQAVLGIANPRIGTISIGEEKGKGNAQVVEAAELLAAAPINYVGNVEGNHVFEGVADVLVADGFVGNVILKLAEGAGTMLQKSLRDALMSRGPLVQLGALLARPGFDVLREKLSYESYGGAPLLGLRGNCIVAHGRSSRIAIRNAIKAASAEAREDVVGKIGALVEPMVGTRT